MGNLEDMTDRQRAAWPEAIKEIARYNVEVQENPDHYDWHFDWSEEVRPGRGQSFSALFINGEHYAQIMMDVYGSPVVSVAALDILHNGSDEECLCEFCKAERWDEYSDEELSDEYERALKVKNYATLAELRAYADTRPGKVIIRSGPSGVQGPLGVVIEPKEVTVEDQMFNARPVETNYAVAPGEYLREWMQENMITFVPLARFMNVKERWLRRFLDGKEPMNSDLAHDLQAITKIPASSWHSFQRQYEKDVARLPWWKRWLLRDGMTR